MLGEDTVETNDVYIKVSFVAGSKHKIKACVDFLDKEKNALFGSKEYEFPVNLDGPNPIKQAYLHLKTLPEFSDATDC